MVEDDSNSSPSSVSDEMSGRVEILRHHCLTATGLVAGCSGDDHGNGTDTSTESTPPSSDTGTSTPIERGAPSNRSSPIGTGTPATMDDYWDGNASWAFLHKSTDIHYDGSHVEVTDDGTWYYFNRRWGSTSNCPDFPEMSTQVRESTDKGRTWSEPVEIISPAAGTPYACAATDGDVWYDADEDMWHYLFQGLDRDGWNGCLLSREGADPMGEFTIEPPGGNPVIDPGQLWDQICTDPDDDCSSISDGPGNVHDEGTFNVFEYDGTHYWVSFHGYDGRYGYRGIAKTSDFQDWIVGDPARGVPGDAVHDKIDTQPWRENWAADGSIGVGHGRMMKEGDYYYHLVEGSDVNLACSRNQNWNYGLFRSRSLANTSWDQFPRGNPIVYSSNGESGDYTKCNVQYAGLFRDPTNDFVYLKYGRRSADDDYDGVYWYRLEKTENLLTNGDLWRADSYGWDTRGENTNVAVYRYPNNSPDGTQYMEVDRGSADEETPAVSQDVTVPPGSSGTLEFGGMFMSEGGSGGLTIAVHQMDQDHGAVRTDRLPIRTGTEWATFGSSAPLSSATRALRYECNFDSDEVYRATDMYLSY